jgi:UDPglucose 6-dehydrogenase
VCVVGAGYVGSLTAITMAAQCPAVHFTVCDINQALVSKWQKAVLPFYEPQLGEYFEKVTAQGNLSYTEQLEAAISKADVVFICVNTPPSKPKPFEKESLGLKTDMTAFFSVIRSIGKASASLS